MPPWWAAVACVDRLRAAASGRLMPALLGLLALAAEAAVPNASAQAE
jgi:hypothetical protein